MRECQSKPANTAAVIKKTVGQSITSILDTYYLDMKKRYARKHLAITRVYFYLEFGNFFMVFCNIYRR